MESVVGTHQVKYGPFTFKISTGKPFQLKAPYLALVDVPEKQAKPFRLRMGLDDVEVERPNEDPELKNSFVEG